MKNKKNKLQGFTPAPVCAGFTLIELVIVIVIISLLSGIGLLSYNTAQIKGRDARRRVDLEQIRAALEQYRSASGFYPNVGGGVWTSASSLSSSLTAYIDVLPDDPLPVGHSGRKPYRYLASGMFGVTSYAYCLGASIESSISTTGSCTPESGYNLGVKNP